MSTNYLDDIELRGAEVIDPSLFQDYESMLGQFPERADIDNHERLDNGLFIKFSELVLYHGSATPDITTFVPAEDDTIGMGLYTTSSPYNASRYAINRARNGQFDPVLYAVHIEDYSFVDLRTNDAVSEFMPGFADHVEEEAPKIIEKYADDFRSYFMTEIYRRCVEIIRAGNLTKGTLKYALQQTGGTFTNYVISQGADGIVAFEGGEFPNGAHDSWVVMKPECAKPVAEVAFKDFVYKRDLTPKEIKEKEERKAALEARFGKPIPPYTPMDQIDLQRNR